MNKYVGNAGKKLLKVKKLHQELTNGNKNTKRPTTATNLIDKATQSPKNDLKQEDTEIKIKYKNRTRGKCLPPDLEQ